MFTSQNCEVDVYRVESESKIPHFRSAECASLRLYTNLGQTDKTSVCCHFEISVNGEVVKGVVPKSTYAADGMPWGNGSTDGFVNFFGQAVEGYGRLQVLMYTKDDHTVYVEIGRWSKCSDAQSDDQNLFGFDNGNWMYRTIIVSPFKDSDGNVNMDLPSTLNGSVQLLWA